MSIRRISMQEYPLMVHQNFRSMKEILNSKLATGSSIINITNDKESYLLYDLIVPFIEAKFTITDIKVENHKILYKLSRQPYSSSSNGAMTNWQSSEDIIKIFESWIKLVNQFHEIDNYYAFESTYEEEVYNELKIDEEDADLTPFSLKQQAVVTLFLASVENILATEDSEDVVEIQQEIAEVNKTITRKTKNQTLRGISKILAKGYKYSKPIGDKIKDEAIKYFIKLGLDYLTSNYTEFLNLLNSNK